MLFRLLVMALLMVQLVGAKWSAAQIGAIQSTLAGVAVDTYLYMPVVAFELPLQAILSWTGPDINTQSDYVAYGYVRNRLAAPMYSVTVLLYMTVYTYSPNFEQFITGTAIATTTTLFTATLPGQPNPFVYRFHGNTRYNQARFNSVMINTGLDQAPNNLSYIALGTTFGKTEDHRITGTVRNNSNGPLRNVRAMFMSTDDVPAQSFPGICAWHPISVLSPTLQPGEAVEYDLDNCNIGTPRLVAQGILSP